MMDDETKKIVREHIGIVAWAMLQNSLRKLDETPVGNIYHVTDFKKVLRHKEYLERHIPRLKVMTPSEWALYVRSKLDEKGQAEFDKKIEEAKAKL
jgi:hypothetical protein